MAITSHGRYCITGIVQYRICLHDDLKWNFLNISHSGTGANLMWTSYPIFSDATLEDHTVALAVLPDSPQRMKTSYGVLIALDSVQRSPLLTGTSAAPGHDCWWAGLGAERHSAAACRSETLRSYATKPGHRPGTTTSQWKIFFTTLGC